MAATKFVRQPDETRKRARRLHHGQAAVAPETIFTLATTAKLRLLLRIFGNGRAGSKANGLKTGSTSRSK